MKLSARQDLAGHLPEDLLTVNAASPAGVPIDAITAACARAESVLTLLMSHFNAASDEDRLHDLVIANVLWDVQGTIGLIRALAIHGDNTTHQAVARKRQ